MVNQFGGRVAGLRSGLNLSLGGLAKEVGVSDVTLGKWELGGSKISFENLQKLIAALLRLKAFTPGQEESEARQLWKLAGVSRAMDEVWLIKALPGKPELSEGSHPTPSPSPDPATSEGVTPSPASPPPSAGPTYIQNAEGAQGPIQTNYGTVIQHFVTHRERACPTPPPPPPVFGGRERQLAELKEKLTQGQSSAITAVQGLGGIGKTTLAHQAAHELYHEGIFASVLNATLGREPAPDPLPILLDWVRYADPAFDPGPLSAQQLAPHVKSHLEALLAEKCAGRTLVLLDDVWDNGLVAARLLLKACPSNSTVLVTSRSNKLVTDLGVKHRLQLEKLSPAEGVAMLGEYLPGVSLMGRDALTRVLDGYTLAVVLAAKRAMDDNPDQPEAALPGHIAEYQKGLQEGTPFDGLELERGEEKQDSLNVTLYYSYAALSEGEKQAFRQLGVLPQDEAFDEQLLEAIWQLEAADTAKTSKRLRLLSLLEVAQSQSQPGLATTGWHSQHSVLRAYARALLKQNEGEYRAATAAYQDGVIRLAEPFKTLPPEDWITQGLEAYRPHLLEVGASLIRETGLSYPADGQGEPAFTAEVAPEVAERALAFARNTYTYLFQRREVREAGWLWLGLAAARHLSDRQRESLFLAELGLFYSDMGEQVAGLACYQQALALCRELSDQEGEAVTLSNIGGVYSDLGDKSQALDYYEKALPLSRAVGDQKGEAASLNNIGLVYKALGDKDKALAYYNQALPLKRAVGDRDGEAVTLNNIGSVYADLGHQDKALDYFQQALSLRRAVGDRAGEAATLNNIGGVYSALGDKTQALDYYEQALPLFRAVGDRDGEAATLTNIGLVYHYLGDKAKALDYYEKALPLIRAVGNRAGEAATLTSIGAVYDDLGDKDKALNYFNQALPLRRAVGDRAGEATTLNNMGWVLWDTGQQTEGLAMVEMALPLLKAVQSPNAKVAEAAIAQMRAELTGGGGASGPSTLPPEQIEMLVNNTIAVRTFAAEKPDEWREVLEGLRAEWAGNGAEWEIEVEFAEALLAVVDGQPAIELPENHPYRPYLARVLDAIKQYEGKNKGGWLKRLMGRQG